MVATLPAIAGKTTYLTQAAICPGTLPAAGTPGALTATLSGIMGSTQTFQLTVPAVQPSAGDPVADSLILNFNPPLAASAVGQAITLSIPATGGGGLNAQVNVIGFQL